MTPEQIQSKITQLQQKRTTKAHLQVRSLRAQLRRLTRDK